MTQSPMGAVRRYFGSQYRRCLEHPLLLLVIIAVLSSAAAYYARELEFDVSAETLIAENDPELEFYRNVVDQFGSDPFVFLTYTPDGGRLFVREQIEHLAAIEARLLEIPGVEEVTSLLDAPLVQSPPVPLTELADGYRTLRDPSADLELAREELTTSPVFKELLISADGRSTVFRIGLAGDRELDRARREYERLEAEGALTGQAWERYDRLRQRHKADRAELIEAIRAVRDESAQGATMYLGGVPMIAADMITFIQNDVFNFGFAIVLLMAIALYVFFRRLRWVLIPLGTTAVTLLLMAGLLGFLEQPLTVISSSFPPLLAIITISFTIHLIARYRELRVEDYAHSHCDLAYEAMASKLAPCVYTALTTVVAFGSLLTSDLVPVVDFGWIMCIGILVSLMVTYIFFASVLVLLPKGRAAATLGQELTLTRWFGRQACKRTHGVLGLALVAGVASGVGMYQLSLGDRFIDYFRDGTEIREGMTFIDKHLGGTIPLDVILRFEPYQQADASQGGAEADPFALGEPEETYPERYWFTPRKIRKVREVQRDLEERPQIGKVISLANLERVAQSFNDGEPLDYVEITAVLAQVPESVRRDLIEPYASPASGAMRIGLRLHETVPPYSRTELVDDIRRHATEEAGFAPDQVRVTGMGILFTEMLRELVRSQTSMLLFVVLATFTMFALLLRSLVLAVVGIVPNLLAAALILALMGVLGVPLDMMTITIAAIVIGIGVDDAIHYLHRFRQEWHAGAAVEDAVVHTHGSVGHALYFTSVVIVIGFSVLMFSNFVPTMHFGWLTSVAMVLALTANLTVLPALLVRIYR